MMCRKLVDLWGYEKAAGYITVASLLFLWADKPR